MTGDLGCPICGAQGGCHCASDSGPVLLVLLLVGAVVWMVIRLV